MPMTVEQIEQIINVSSETTLPSWLQQHPHSDPEFRKISHNTIYIARETLSLDNSLPGWGHFRFVKDLILTDQTQSKKSIWALPYNIFGEVDISFHSSPWKNGTFQSVGRGQEFVMTTTPKIQNWALSKIRKGLRL